MVREVGPCEVASSTGGFHSISEIGEGGFGKVYRAMLNQRPVAIKVMAADSLQGHAEFDNERSLLSRLSHGHLVRLLGVCRSSDPPLRCLIYELMPGGNVEEQLANQAGRCVLHWWLRLRIAAQIAAALSYLHSLPAGPIIHRDIKPANFFLDGRLNAKLGDVGLATPASGPNGTASNSSRSGSIRQGEQDMVGTYAYLPPEYKTSGQLSLKTDVFALGVSLLQLATGQLERLHDLLPRCREAVAAGQAAAVLDDKAGSWDEAAGERLLCLGLWSCSDSSEQRPTAQLLAQELAKLWLATDQMLRSQQQQQQQQQAGSTLSLSQQQQLLPSQLLSQQQPQQQQQQQQHSSGPGGGSFWRFLTNAGSSR